MINDNIIEAMDFLMECCSSPEERTGMHKMQNMLIDWSDDDWIEMTDDEKEAFVRSYI